MVAVDYDLCSGCGVCIKRFQGYCIRDDRGRPAIDAAICNQCQKCVAICPARAIRVAGRQPLRIEAPLSMKPEELIDLLRRRRSCKRFEKKPLPPEILRELANSAAYGQNQNKNIDIVIVDDPELIGAIDGAALRFFGRIHRIVVLLERLTRFFHCFVKPLAEVKHKMDYDLQYRKQVIKENTPALLLLIGNPRVPVTESSAHYLAGVMSLYAEVLGLGSCVMDSVKLAINVTRSIRKRLGITGSDRVLAVLAAGYSAENIVNIAQGYEIKVGWNGRA